MDLSGKVAIVTGFGAGWSADAIAGVRAGTFAPPQQPVGQQLPEPPK